MEGWYLRLFLFIIVQSKEQALVFLKGFILPKTRLVMPAKRTKWIKIGIFSYVLLQWRLHRQASRRCRLIR